MEFEAKPRFPLRERGPENRPASKRQGNGLRFLLLGLAWCGLLWIGGCSPSPPEEPAPHATAPAEQPSVERLPAEPESVESNASAEPEENGNEPSGVTLERKPLPGAEPAAVPTEPSVKAPMADSESADAPDAEPKKSDDEPRGLVAPDPAADPVDPDFGRNPAEIAAEKAFAAPEKARRLSPKSQLWIDPERGRLIVDGYVTLREGPLEMFACPVGTKEHESVVSVLAPSRFVHAGLLAIGAMSGTPVSFSPEYRPATGQRIAIWVMWRSAEGEIKKAPAQQWVKYTGTEKPLELDWVFAGSSFWQDPETGQEYYQADSGDLVCVSNFSTATLDLPIESSQSNAALQFSAFTENIPPRGTPVRLVFVPIPLPADEPRPAAEDRVDASKPPEDALLKPQEPTK